METKILSVGLLVFFSHFLSLQFQKTNIPDVLVLMLFGILLGPLLGIVVPEHFGKVGSVVATIALVVILFESGTSLNLDVLRSSIGTTGKLTFACLAITASIVIFIGYFFLQLSWIASALLGIILAGTSSAVVIPMINSLKLGEKASTVLILESALTDVICIVGVFALLQIVSQGSVEPGKLIGGILSALVFAGVIGYVGGIGWMLVLSKIRGFPNTISSTLAFVFIVYGVTETLGFSGAIAALAMGIALNNYDKLGLKRIQALVKQEIKPLTEMDLSFYREAVFLLKTFFFVFLGISIQFRSQNIAITALVMILIIFGARLVLSRFIYEGKEFSLRDAAISSMLAPKGLAAAVLAVMPLQYGVVGGEVIRDTVNMAVLISISLCALLVMIYKHSGVQLVYSRLLAKPNE
jgi:NhaP-type Na+/H+ or K+/H+ antiporter